MQPSFVSEWEVTVGEDKGGLPTKHPESIITIVADSDLFTINTYTAFSCDSIGLRISQGICVCVREGEVLREYVKKGSSDHQ